MRVPIVAIVLSLPALALAQTCTVSPPAFVVSCPCPGSGPFLDFTGTGRIGTVQRLSATSDYCHPLSPNYMVVGLPFAVPIPIPNGLVACNRDMSPVSLLTIDPVYVTPINGYFADPSTGCNSQFLPYFLFIPNQPSLIGVSVHAQFFEQLNGVGNAQVPLVASAVIGFTVQP